MDILIILFLLAVMYLVPELLRRRNPKKYEYPEVPGTNGTEITMLEDKKKQFLNETYQETIFMSPVAKTPPAHLATVNVPTIAEEQNAWQGKLDNVIIMNGIIFAEIIQPPRSQRPLPGWRTRSGKN